ncbi:MAG: chloride channel protein [Acidimicrobiales bacterium]
MRTRHASERQRIPPPLIKRRIASGRGAMEQPNVTHDGEAALSARFWLAVAVTGVATGLLGDLLMAVLSLVERWAFHAHTSSYSSAVASSSDLRRVLNLVVAGVVGAGSWFLIRRYLRHERADFDDALWRGDADLGVRRSFLTSVTSEVVVGLGASIGREAAPKLMGGASGSLFSRFLGLSPAQRRLLVACGGGAGLAAVYNVPLGGAIFTAEVLVGSFALPVVLPALACSMIATVTAWITLPHGPTYPDVAHVALHASIVVWSVPAGLVVGALALVYVRVIGWVSHHRASGTAILWVMPATFAAVGLLGVAYPQLFGNGQDIAHLAFIGAGGLGLFFALAMLKPLVTAATLGSGAAGGLFTPFLATGAALGAFLGGAWGHVWSGTPVGAYALVGAAAMIGAAMQAPLAGLVLVLELTHSSFTLAVPMMAATLIAAFVVRQVDGYSIYSARLPHDDAAATAAPTARVVAPVDVERVEGVPQTVVRRDFAATREDVFRAWTDPGLVARWWGSATTSVTSCAFDLVEGGEYRVEMRGSDGARFAVHGTIHDVVAPRAFAMTVLLDEYRAEFLTSLRPAGSPHAGEAPEWHFALTFTEAGDATTVELLATYPVEGDRDALIVLDAARAWAEGFERLDALLATG